MSGLYGDSEAEFLDSSFSDARIVVLCRYAQQVYVSSLTPADHAKLPCVVRSPHANKLCQDQHYDVPGRMSLVYCSHALPTEVGPHLQALRRPFRQRFRGYPGTSDSSAASMQRLSINSARCDISVLVPIKLPNRGRYLGFIEQHWMPGTLV